jgi:Skp family chaperone for outer membrane proteins
MEVKMLFLLLVPLLIIQLDSATIGPSNLHALTRDVPSWIYTIAKGGIEQLKTTLKEKVVSALSDLQKLQHYVTDLSNSLAESGKAQMQDIFHDLVELLIAIKDEAERKNMDISQCLDEREDQLYGLPDQLNNEMMVCLTNRGNEFSVVHNIMKVPSVVNDLSVQLEFCGPDNSMNLCSLHIVQEVVVDLNALPERIDDEVRRVNGTVDELELVLTECVETKVAQIEDDGIQILKDILICYWDMLG